MQNTVTELFKFQELYLEQLMGNVPEERLYEKQLKGFNSAGWILGHLCVEVEDVFDYLKTPYYKVDESWTTWFKNAEKGITTLDNLPTKSELMHVFQIRYEELCKVYEGFNSRDRFSGHPSKFLENHLPNLDAWVAHHLTTHIAIHCGNIAVWKKVIGLHVGGY